MRTFLLMFSLACWYSVACGYEAVVKKAEVDSARLGQEVACQRYLDRFVAGARDGLTCEAAKARAQADNPLCNLSFSCPVRDAGREAGVE